MSRNLCRTDCDVCGAEPVTLGAIRRITKEDAGRYFHEYQGMLVADAECPDCNARYLAWVKPAPGHRETHGFYGPIYYDLSYRSTFNDEPGPEDLPVPDVVEAAQRLMERWPEDEDVRLVLAWVLRRTASPYRSAE